jgi:hypothetical protein
LFRVRRTQRHRGGASIAALIELTAHHWHGFRHGAHVTLNESHKQSGKTETYFKQQIGGLKLPDDVYGRPGDGSGNGTWKCAIFAGSKVDHDEVVEILRANGIAFIPAKPFEWPGLSSDEKHPFDALTLPVVITGEVTDTHRRAHAKILMNFIAKYFGEEEALLPHWDFLRAFARGEAEKIKYKVLESPFPDGQDSDVLKIIRSSITVRIENSGGNIAGSPQFYGNQIYHYLLRENAALRKISSLDIAIPTEKSPKFLSRPKMRQARERWLQRKHLGPTPIESRNRR